MSARDLMGGVDEVGRGPLAGPVVAAAVIFERGMQLEGIRDSKRVPAGERQELSELIRRMSVSWAIGAATVAEVDHINIHQATKQNWFINFLTQRLFSSLPISRRVMVSGTILIYALSKDDALP